MIRKVLIISVILAGLMSCTKDDTVPEKIIDEGGEPVAFTFSFDNLLNDTEYNPMMMRSSSDEVKATLSGGYKVIILKEINVDWIIEKIEEKNFPGYIYRLKEDSTPLEYYTELRPGKYRLVVFTSPNAMQWHPNIKEGAIINVNDMACTYSIQGGSYLTPGQYVLGSQVFSKMIEFNVVKNQELTTPPQNNTHNMTLERKVGAIRVLLKDEASDDNSNYYNITGFIGYFGIIARLEAESGKQFCEGLNIWGEPWYGSTPLTTMYVSFFATQNSVLAGNGSKYFLTNVTAREQNFCLFTSPTDTVDFKLAYVDVSGVSGNPRFIYNGMPIESELVHNKLTGFVFKPADKIAGTDQELKYLAGENATTLFNSYIEYNAE